ncbi:hypothetical protein LCGC14_2587760 [marine sediment metagenome]|uniref:Uncharacterized protein n=1 Tax=marine sediment metagenome TaxID=412755 RepID=A0A0F9ACI4_9ZZZZ
MNGGMTECGVCGRDPCVCEHLRIVQGKAVTEIGIDVFSKVKQWRIKIIKWLWPDLQRLSDALYDYWDKS